MCKEGAPLPPPPKGGGFRGENLMIHKMITGTPLQCAVRTNDTLQKLVHPFDYVVPDVVYTQTWGLPPDVTVSGLVVVVGSSGSGKTTFLKTQPQQKPPTWDDDCGIGSHFADENVASRALIGAGLGSVPDWVKPYRILSTGQRFRADLARMLAAAEAGQDVCIDEYSSTIDRTVARAASVSVARFLRKLPTGNSRFVVATCHRDVLEWLTPDWVIDLDAGTVEHTSGRWLQPRINITIHQTKDRDVWNRFAPHHYLTAKLAPATRKYVAYMNNEHGGSELVAFIATMSSPSGTVKNAFREHRLVVLPEYQGLGIGPRVSDAVASLYGTGTSRYFAKTSHPRLGEYRENSALWKPTSKNKIQRKDLCLTARWAVPLNRMTYSHEYIGG
jgi:GNAT superfamily N-acetyltransferase